MTKPLLFTAFALLAVLTALSCASGGPAVEAAEPAEAQESAGGTFDLEGIWQGVLEAGGRSIRLVFRIERQGDGWQAVLDSPDEGVSGIAVESVYLEGRDVRFELPMVAAVYEGEIDQEGGRIVGAWKQGGGSFAVTLKPAEAVEKVRRPQDPEPPYPYREEEVRFENARDGITLAGTLTLPQTGAPFAAAVLISGSGAQNRNEEVFNHRPFLVMADTLTRRGFAVLRYDDRGVGDSEGNAEAADSRDLAGDAWAAAAGLLEREDIGAVGFIGHSEGGLIAPMAAVEHPEIAFVVLLAGSGLPGDELLALQSRTILAARGVGKAQIDVIDQANRRIYDVVKAEPDDAAAAEEIRSIMKSLGMQDSQIDAQIRGLLAPWMRFFLSYDPRPTLRELRCPVLALNGSLDVQVPPEENLGAIREALQEGGNPNFRVQRLEGLNHLFQHAESGQVEEYARIEETFAPEALELIAVWLDGVVNP